ncbi:hypothetical protein C8N33_11847 [Pararhodobacter aggregans]|nr:hypothetical protein C8N33_11847 [Pararhodobacter aggregans]
MESQTQRKVCSGFGNGLVGDLIRPELPHTLRNHRHTCTDRDKGQDCMHSMRLLRDSRYEPGFRTKADDLKVEAAPLDHRPQHEILVRYVGKTKIVFTRQRMA